MISTVTRAYLTEMLLEALTRRGENNSNNKTDACRSARRTFGAAQGEDSANWRDMNHNTSVAKLRTQANTLKQ